MLESIKKISNPLTIVAIFAGLAEITGTGVFPFLKDDSQGIYIWFLMGFPTLLILLFFVTLNFNYKVLYAPSDFADENKFMKLLSRPTAEERLMKLSLVNENDMGASPERQSETQNQKVDLKYRAAIWRNSASIHYLAEELVITKLSQEFDEIEKEVLLRSGKSQFLFDAIAKKGTKVFAVEVKYLKDRQTLKNVRSSLVKINRTLSELPVESAGFMTVILAWQCTRIERTY